MQQAFGVVLPLAVNYFPNVRSRQSSWAFLGVSKAVLISPNAMYIKMYIQGVTSVPLPMLQYDVFLPKHALRPYALD